MHIVFLWKVSLTYRGLWEIDDLKQAYHVISYNYLKIQYHLQNAESLPEEKTSQPRQTKRPYSISLLIHQRTE